MVKKRANSKISVIIVNYNGKNYLKPCLKSLTASSYSKSKTQIIVVDNGSSDGSVRLLKNEFPKIHTIINTMNMGFAKANNQGINLAIQSNSKYIITLNNDTKVTKDWALNLVKFMEDRPDAGSAVGKILKMKPGNIIDSTGDFWVKDTLRIFNRGQNTADKGQFENLEECFSACAAGAIYRTEAIKSTMMNGEVFDEKFVSYYEDLDLSTRLRLLGWKCYYCPSAVMHHKGSSTSAKLSWIYKEFYSRRNRLLYALKNFPLNISLKLSVKYILPTRKGLAHYQETNFEDKDVPSCLEIAAIQLIAITSALFKFSGMYHKRRLILNSTKISEAKITSWFSKLAISA
jgi:GT2 family glycosyltransferase